MSAAFSKVYVDRVLDPGYRNWKRLYLKDSLAVHRAHLVMLEERSILPPGTAAALKVAMDRLETEFTPPERIPEGNEDLYFVYEHELERLAGSEEAAWLHTARSRNDMDNTVFRLALKRELLALLRSFADCAAVFLERARKGEGELTVLFTHGQPANPSTMAHYLSAFLLEFLESAAAIGRALDSVDLCTLGACAITGTGFAIDRERTSRLLGFAAPLENSYRAISSSHWLVLPAQALALAMGDITRLAADLLHKASCEVGLVDFPDDLVQASSIMPQKRNPVVIEHLRIQANLVAGTCSSIIDLFRNVPWQDVNELADAPVSDFIAAIGDARSCIDLLSEAVAKLRSDPVRAREICLRFGVTTTELADTLVRECGIGFRAAHRACSAFARSGLDKAVLRSAYREAAGRELKLGDAEIDSALQPERFVAVRGSAGGPAPAGMVGVWAAAEAGLGALTGTIAAHEERDRSAAAELAAAWALFGSRRSR
jgi:argininosuccinate lyase